MYKPELDLENTWLTVIQIILSAIGIVPKNLNKDWESQQELCQFTPQHSWNQQECLEEFLEAEENS